MKNVNREDSRNSDQMYTNTDIKTYHEYNLFLRRNEIELIDYDKVDDSDFRFCFIFPEPYTRAINGLGWSIIHQVLAEKKGIELDRIYYPPQEYLDQLDKLSNNEKRKYPITMNQHCYTDFDILAFSITHFTLYSNVIQILDLLGIPLLSDERKNSDIKYPLIIAGGGALTINPEPIHNVFDYVSIGDGEETISHLVDCIHSQKKKNPLSPIKIDGLYKPCDLVEKYDKHGIIIENCLEHDRKQVRRAVVTLDKFPGFSHVYTELELDRYFGQQVGAQKSYTYPIVKFEMSRGCGHNCNFCQYNYNCSPPRFRDYRNFLETIKRYRNSSKKQRIDLISAHSTDVPYIDELVKELKELGFITSFFSIRADRISKDQINSILENRNFVAISPETGSERVKKYFNKEVDDSVFEEEVRLLSSIQGEDGQKIEIIVINIIVTAFELEIDPTFHDTITFLQKLSMIGSQNNKDIVFRLGLQPLVPQLGSPFEGERMLSYSEYSDIANLFITELSPYRYSIRTFDELTFYQEALISRGDERVFEILVRASQNGNNINSWKKAIDQSGYSLDFWSRKRTDNEILPASFIDRRFKDNYLKTRKKINNSCYQKCLSCGKELKSFCEIE